MPRLVDADKHEVTAAPKNGRIGRLILDRPALRDPAADGTVEATPTLLDGDSSTPVTCQHHYQQHDHAKSEDAKQHPDPCRGGVVIRR